MKARKDRKVQELRPGDRVRFRGEWYTVQGGRVDVVLNLTLEAGAEKGMRIAQRFHYNDIIDSEREEGTE